MAKKKKVFDFKGDNKKFGKGIYYISIDREQSCVGASPVCRDVCYGGCNRFEWITFVLCYLRYYELSLSASFPEEIIASLEGKHPLAFRIHDVGDFYSAKYIQKWRKIVRARRDIMFFAYTRVWVLPELVAALQQLAAEPNITLFLSLDHSMPCDRIPPELAHLPRAWLAVNDDDIPPSHLRINVVFRNLREELTRLEDLNHFGAMVCPAETKRGPKITCDICGFCPRRWKKEHAGGCREVAADTAKGCTAGTGLS